jgi:hypothetical protein
VAHAQIAAFARLAKENTPPSRVIQGQQTLLARTMHDIRYDSIHDEFFVNNPFAYAVLVFRGGASGEEPPIRIIQGPRTRIGSTSRLGIDPVNNEIFVSGTGGMLVFDREANGNVPPKRVLGGPETKMRGAGVFAVDPVRNLLIVGTSGSYASPGALLIFDRTASGNVPPKRAITGPKTGIARIHGLKVYPPTGWMVVAQPGEGGGLMHPEGSFVGFWHIDDDGDVPPRWKLSGPKSTLLKPRGVDLVPSQKEVIIADMTLNSVLTFYFPEIF